MRRQPSLVLDLANRPIILGVLVHAPRTRVMVHRDTEFARPLDAALGRPLMEGSAVLPVLAVGTVREGRANLGLGKGLEGHLALLVGVLAPGVHVNGHRRAPVPVVAPAGAAVRVRVRMWVVVVSVCTAGAGEFHNE